MPSKNPAQRLADILENSKAIEEFTSGMTFEAFQADRKTVYAVSRALEIISEASRRLPDELKDRHPEIDWRGLAGLGNVYRHDYDVVDLHLVWESLIRRLPALQEAARFELKRLGHEFD